MTLGERLKKLRTDKSFSQEKVAEMVGVSRQAVTKWENNQTVPSAENLIALAGIYGISVDEMVTAAATDNIQDKKILHTNLTLIAIILQASFLNAATVRFPQDTGIIVMIKIIPLLLCSIWMSCNLHYEKNLRQRRKNSKIELLYCIVQAVTAVMKYYGKIPFGTVFIMVNAIVYIFFVNPRYMKRVLTKKKS